MVFKLTTYHIFVVLTPVLNSFFFYTQWSTQHRYQTLSMAFAILPMSRGLSG